MSVQRGKEYFTISVVSSMFNIQPQTLRLYEREGVSEYWVVAPKLEVVRVYRRESGSFGRVIELKRELGDTLTTPLLPGLQMPLSKIFEN